MYRIDLFDRVKKLKKRSGTMLFSILYAKAKSLTMHLSWRDDNLISVNTGDLISQSSGEANLNELIQFYLYVVYNMDFKF